MIVAVVVLVFARQVRPRQDVAPMDLRVPRCDGAEATGPIRAEYLLSSKDVGGGESVRVVRSVLPGDAGLSSGIQRCLLERLPEAEVAVPAQRLRTG